MKLKTKIIQNKGLKLVPSLNWNQQASYIVKSSIWRTNNLKKMTQPWNQQVLVLKNIPSTQNQKVVHFRINTKPWPVDSSKKIPIQPTLVDSPLLLSKMVSFVLDRMRRGYIVLFIIANTMHILLVKLWKSSLSSCKCQCNFWYAHHNLSAYSREVNHKWGGRSSLQNELESKYS